MWLTPKLTIRPAVAGNPPGATLGPRVLADFELVWMVSGQAHWHWRDTGTELTLEPGTLLLVRPGMRDGFSWDRERPSRHGFVHFRLTPTPQATAWPLVRPVVSPGPIGALLDYLLWLAEEPTPRWREATEETIATIVRVFASGPLPGVDDYRTAEPAPLAVALDHVRREWNQIGMRPIPMDELVKVAAISREHLARLFRRRYGLGMITALEQVRLARAVTLLTRSNFAIGEVARTCGYTDPLHFSRRFRANFGSSPRAYRNSGAEASPLTSASLIRLAHRLTLDRNP